MTDSSEKKAPEKARSEGKRPGSARAKLEAFDRQQRQKSVLTKKLITMAVILAIVIGGKVAFDHFSSSDRDWFAIPKDAAWQLQSGDWDSLAKHLSDDCVIDVSGKKFSSPKEALEFLRTRGDTLPIFTTHPHAFGESEVGPWVSFFATWARGDLKQKNVVPIVQTWLVHAELKKDDGRWQAARLTIRPTFPVE